MSIQARLTLAMAVVLTLCLAVLGTVLIGSTRATLVDDIDGEVRSAACRAWAMSEADKGESSPGDGDEFGPGTGQGGPRFPDGWDRQPSRDGAGTAVADDDGDGNQADPSAGYVKRPVARFIYTALGVQVAAQPSGYLDDPDPAPEIAAITGDRLARVIGRIVTVRSADGTVAYRVLVERGRNDAIYVTAAPLTQVEATIRRLVRTLLLVGVIGLVAAMAVNAWLIRAGLRPVDQMVDTAAAIAAGDLGRRVPHANAHSELGRLGQALNDMLNQIERAVRARAASEDRLRRFVADAAYELRTPLTSLRGYAELYRQGALPDAAAVGNAMGRIEGEGARMASLVDDLLLLARLDEPRALERTPVDLSQLVEDAVDAFRVIAPDRPIAARVMPGVMIQGDRPRLRQVIDNLLTNARVHTPAGTAVHVSVGREGAGATVRVRDEGEGIPAGVRSRVFERFWRADPARTRSRGGTGLGLAIVASLVEAHGGRVEVESEPGEGATFILHLPIAAAPNPSRPPSGNPGRDALPGSERTVPANS